MKSRSKPRRLHKSKASLIALVAALIIGYLSGVEPRELIRMLHDGLDTQETTKSESAPSTSRPNVSRTTTKPTGKDFHGYSRLDNAALASWGGNDGDSFKVRHDGETYIFRLYFVDTPESNFRFPDRVGHQARYFKTSREDAVAVGKDAKKFTSALLQGRKFTVYTRWESVMGSDRFHAFVVAPSGDFLCEELVKRGLARIYTMPADLPDGRSKGKFKAHLKKVESTARAQRVGGWE